MPRVYAVRYHKSRIGIEKCAFRKVATARHAAAGIAAALPKFIVVHLAETRSNLLAVDWRFVREVGQIVLHSFALPMCGREKGTTGDVLELNREKRRI